MWEYKTVCMPTRDSQKKMVEMYCQDGWEPFAVSVAPNGAETVHLRRQEG